MGVSRRALGKLLGVSDTAVRKAIRAGHVEVLADGTIDPDEARERWAARTDPATSKVKAAGSQVRKVRTEADAKEAIAFIQRILREEGAPAGRLLDFDLVRTAETILKARERELRMQVVAGKLVDADAVHAEVFRLAREDRDALTNWPSQAAPLIAAEIGADAVKLAVSMDKYVRLYLAERAERPELHV